MAGQVVLSQFQKTRNSQGGEAVVPNHFSFLFSFSKDFNPITSHQATKVHKYWLSPHLSPRPSAISSLLVSLLSPFFSQWHFLYTATRVILLKDIKLYHFQAQNFLMAFSHRIKLRVLRGLQCLAWSDPQVSLLLYPLPSYHFLSSSLHSSHIRLLSGLQQAADIIIWRMTPASGPSHMQFLPPGTQLLPDIQMALCPANRSPSDYTTENAYLILSGLLCDK